jgi:hypothetical protein
MAPLARETRNVHRHRRPRRHGAQVVCSEKAARVPKPAAHRTCSAHPGGLGTTVLRPRGARCRHWGGGVASADGPDNKQIPRSPRRNGLPMARIQGSLLMSSQPLACAPRKLLEVANTASGPHRVLQHPPKAFDRVEVVPTMGGEAMEATRVMVVLQGRVALVCPLHPAAIHDHHDLCAGFPAGGPHVMAIVA